MKIYISGKISGLPKEIYESNFNCTEILLKEMYPYALVFNPINITAHLDPEKNSWKEYMIANINVLLDCDTIFMMGNWKGSKGAKVEFAIALEMNFIIKYEKYIDFNGF